MSVAPTGPLGVPFARLAELLAASAAFRTLVGAADASAALDKVHLFAMDPREHARPYAHVYQGEDYVFDRVAQAAYFTRTGELRVALCADVEANASDADAEATFLNAVGAVLAEVVELAGTDDYLAIRRMRALTPALRSSREEALSDADGDYYLMAWSIEWGP